MMANLLALHRINIQRNLGVIQLLQDQQRLAQMRQVRDRRWWTRQWLLRRTDFGQYEMLMNELRAEDPSAFRNFLRFEPQMFQEILDRISPRIHKPDTNFRKSHVPGLKLAITLCHLATGDSYHSLMYSFRVAHNTISKHVREVCHAIVDEYSEEVVKCPSSPAEWKVISQRFADMVNHIYVKTMS